MEIEITSKRENQLLKRIEIMFEATHSKQGTPNRDNLRQEIAKSLSVKKDFVILDRIRSEFGRTKTVGYAKVYKSKEDALRIERKPILIRMGLMAAEVKEKKEKKAPPPKEAPKKEEAKPSEKPEAKEEAPKKKEEKPKEEKPAPAEKPKKAKAERTEAKKPAKGGK